MTPPEPLSLAEALAELGKHLPPDAFPPCRVCGNIVLSDGEESPPDGPICGGCLEAEGDRCRKAIGKIAALIRLTENGVYYGDFDLAGLKAIVAEAKACGKSNQETNE